MKYCQATTWKNHENTTLTEGSQSPQVTNCMIPFIGGGLVAKSCLTLATPWTCQPAWFLCPWDSPGRNTRVGCHFLLQAIFPTQG